MKSRKTSYPILAFAALACLSLASCHERCGCPYDEEPIGCAKCEVDCNWDVISEFTDDRIDSEYGHKVTGWTLWCWNLNTGESFNASSNDLNHIVIPLTAGSYKYAGTNQSPSEFSYVDFKDMDSPEYARILAKPADKVQWFEGDVIYEPDWLVSETKTGMEVEENICTAYSAFNCACEDCLCLKEHFMNSPVYLKGSLKMQPIIWKLNVIVHIEGIHNLKSARAAISGLADGYSIAESHPLGSTSSQLLSSWKKTLSEEDSTIGEIDCTVYSFGLPYGHDLNFNKNPFDIQIALVDKQTVLNKNFEVVDGIEVDPESQTITIRIDYGERLPDVVPAGNGTGGFSAVVDDWGEDEEIDLNI